MALLWAESFDFYNVASMADILLRGYAGQAKFGFSASGQGRTGNYAIVLGQTDDGYFERVLDAPTNVIGSGVAIMATVQPDNGNRYEKGIHFGNSFVQSEVAIIINGSLGISVYSTTGVLLGQSANNLFSLGSYFYLEARARNNAFGGGLNTSDLVVRVNGNPVIAITGLNYTNQWTRVTLGEQNGNASSSIAYFDDWVIWDNSGTINNDFLGDRKCVTVLPNANGPTQDWTASTPPAWDCINEAPPSDADYIEAATVGNISEFDKTDIPIATASVSGLVLVARALKTDAGAGSLTLGMKSNGVLVEGADKLLNTTVAYYSSTFERNPDGNIAWTKAAVDAALISLRKSA